MELLIGRIIAVVARDENKLIIWLVNIKLKLNLYLHTMIYRNMKSIKGLDKLIEKWREFYYFNFSYNEHLQMLIVLHILLFLMSYDKWRYESWWQWDKLWLLLVKLIFDRIIHLMFHVLDSIPNS